MKLLKKLYQISSPSNQETKMQKFIISLLKGMGVSYTQDKKGNIYAIKGKAETYPCVVCHIDEVHKFRSSGYKVVETDGVIYGFNASKMSFEGIGADDKNGIWVCIKALNEFEVIKCAFFVAEEVGCQGSHCADMTFFDDCRFVLQCDRKGNADFITNASCTELCSDKFVKDANIGLFGYKEANGLMTDVMELKEKGLKVSCCNISCGYYNPHTNNEMTRISDLYNCYALVKNIIESCTKVYPHKYKKPEYKYSSKSNFGGYNWYSHKKDPIVSRLQELYTYAWEANGKYIVWDSDKHVSREANEEDLRYAANIEFYEGLQDYYDEIKFDKDLNVLVRCNGEDDFHEPDEAILDEVTGVNEDLKWNEYDEMCQKMELYALGDPDMFSIEQFINTYEGMFPHLEYEDYQQACEEIVGCRC